MKHSNGEILYGKKTLGNNKKACKIQTFKKAQTGFEPVDTGVADHCLTTWLLRHPMTPTGIEPVLPP